jgi:tetratricopeptide (TPR) repeat protein
MTNHADQAGSPASPFLMERLLREAYRREKRYQIESDAEFMTEAAQDGLAETRAAALEDDPIEMAQELAYQAYESSGSDEARDLVGRALALDPRCVDALIIHAFLDSDDAGTLIDALERAVAVGESGLGEEFFAEHMGDFWPLVQARPYLRAVKQCAEVLWNVGRRLDAVARYEDLMDLDPSDQMGNAALLLGYYLAMGEVQRAWDLLEQSDAEGNPVQAWAWVLLFLLIGDEDAAREALTEAVDLNPHVAARLVGLGDGTGDEVPLHFLAGSEEEAAYTLEILGEGWERAGDARLWLYNVLLDRGMIEIEADDSTPA